MAGIVIKVLEFNFNTYVLTAPKSRVAVISAKNNKR